jgi:exopolyphosphatase/guanosine-5'-triphosphate,3'-diphosphate pyrophosphatase
LRVRYLQTGWETAIGSSGTVLAITEICRQMAWAEKDIDAAAVAHLRDKLFTFQTIEEVVLPGLSERRHPVLVGGLAMLSACFDVFELDVLKASPFALREGVLHDLLGRLENRDPREKTIQAFKTRYAVDPDQVRRVSKTALKAYHQIHDELTLRPTHQQLLGWAADLHEVGLSVSHSHYQKHSGYLVSYSDMAGFTQQEQLFLAALIQYHRRPVAKGFARSLPARLHEPLRLTMFCLRLACILCRTRDNLAIPEFQLSRNDHEISVEFPPEWQRTHPLTLADLRREVEELEMIGLQFHIRESD